MQDPTMTGTLCFESSILGIVSFVRALIGTHSSPGIQRQSVRCSSRGTPRIIGRYLDERASAKTESPSD